jgi:hypothetical protein
MKHILPILTVTTLSAAAFAQTAAAAPAGLSYNRVGVSYQTNKDSAGKHPTSISASAFIGSSNVLVSGTADLTAAGSDSVSLGYVFKNVAAGVDATVSIASNDNYGINLRRALNEIVSGLEVAVGYNRAIGKNYKSNWVYELSYNFNKQYSIAYSITDPNGNAKSVNEVSLRYNF